MKKYFFTSAENVYQFKADSKEVMELLDATPLMSGTSEATTYKRSLISEIFIWTFGYVLAFFTPITFWHLVLF